MRRGASEHLIRCLEAGGIHNCPKHCGQLSLSYEGLRISDLKGHLGDCSISLNLIGLIFNDRILSSAAFPRWGCLRVATRRRGSQIVSHVLRRMLVALCDCLVAGLHSSRLLEIMDLNGSFDIESLSAPRWALIDAI